MFSCCGLLITKHQFWGCAMAEAVSRRPLAAEARVGSLRQSMWDLGWREWHCDRFFAEYFGFPLSVSFHLCSITRENGKKLSSSHGCTINLKVAVRT
jgi:hypothetical protein